MAKNDHLPGYFNLLLCSQQLRREQFDKLFGIDRFFQDFEALSTWIFIGVTINPDLPPRIRHVGIHTGRKARLSDCNNAYNDSELQTSFSRLPGLRTLHISQPFTLGSFVMNTKEVEEIMVSIFKRCPNLQRLAILVPVENLDFLYNLPELQVLAMATPLFFEDEIPYQQCLLYRI